MKHVDADSPVAGTMVVQNVLGIREGVRSVEERKKRGQQEGGQRQCKRERERERAERKTEGGSA